MKAKKEPRPFNLSPDPDGFYDIKITQQLNPHQGWVMTLTFDEARSLRHLLGIALKWEEENTVRPHH